MGDIVASFGSSSLPNFTKQSVEVFNQIVNSYLPLRLLHKMAYLRTECPKSGWPMIKIRIDGISHASNLIERSVKELQVPVKVTEQFST
jgi:hypothetical protein